MADVISLSARWWTTSRGVHPPSEGRWSSSSAERRPLSTRAPPERVYVPTGRQSSFTIVALAWGSEIMRTAEGDGEDRFRENVSLGSTAVSPVTGTATVFVRGSPGFQVRVVERAV